MHNVQVGFLLFLAGIFVVGSLGGLLYVMYLPFKKFLLRTGRLTLEHSRKINTIYITILSVCFLILFCFLHIEFFPRDSFYLEEFKDNTGLDLPSFAAIREKDATYPDYFGDYWAGAVIELDKADFKKLQVDISQLKNFQVDTTAQKIGITDTYDELTADIKESDIETVFCSSKTWFKVAFLKDGRTIIFERSTY